MKSCRICGSNQLSVFLSLGNSPLANSYLAEEELHNMEPYYPLEVYICEDCYLVQLEEHETVRKIFSSNYAYFSSYSDSWLEHCKRYVEMMINRFRLDKESFIIEIGSNDGYLLQYFKRAGIPVLGVEPSSSTAEAAIEKGIPTDIVFFDEPYANSMKESGRSADLIIGNNVLAHNPNLHEFIEGIKIALRPDGIITMEFPHLLKLIQENQFDTIYHEHFSYFSFRTAKQLFELHDLTFFDVEELPTHGGSLRVYAKRTDDAINEVTSKVSELLQKEERAGMLELGTYYNLDKRVKRTKRDLLQLLIQMKNEKKRIAGYGAPAKGNTLLNYCGIGNDILDYTVDRNPQKQQMFLPGTHIPILHPERIREDKPDYLLILPWNIKEEIMEQMNHIREWGGSFIIPIPSVEVL